MEPDGRPAGTAATPDDLGGHPTVQTAAAGWPNIADYWPDAPHRMGLVADIQEPWGTAPTRTGPALHAQAGQERATAYGGVPPPRQTGLDPPPRPPRVTKPLLAVAFAVVIVLAGGSVAVSRLITRTTAANSTLTPPTPTVPAPADGSPAPISVLPDPAVSSTAPTTRPAPSRRADPDPAPPPPPTGTLSLASGLADITVTTGRVADGVAAVTTPRGSAPQPRVSRSDGTVKVVVGRSGPGEASVVDIRLDDRVAWTIRLDGGARTFVADMSGATVRRFDLDGGVARAELTLPRLAATLPIAMSGGVKLWRIRTDGPAAVRVRARHGIGRAVLYGDDRGSVPGNGTVTSSSAGTRGAVSIDAAAGIGALAVSG